PSNSFGRSNGVPISYLFEKFPEMSGSPQGVFAGVQGLAVDVRAGVRFCADTGTTADHAATTPTATAAPDISTRGRMRAPSRNDRRSMGSRRRDCQGRDALGRERQDG